MIRDPDHPHTHQGNLANKAATATWVDSIDIVYKESDGHSLFGSTGIQPEDIEQGEIGNCWFMHGASAVAERAGRLEKVFLNDGLSNNGIYGCQMYILGVPTTITVDDEMPLDDFGKSVFAGVSKDGALWGPIIEKCFAKLHGTYESIISGDPRHSIEVLHGSPSSNYSHGDKTAAQIFALVKDADAIHGMISASTPGESDEDKSARGIAQKHVYTVLSAHEAVNGQGQTVKLYRIRNPWGKEHYNGPYSDDDTSRWDTTLQNNVNYHNENDGTFFIDIDTYHAEFEATSIHTDTTNMKHSYFLITNDASTT